jgi:acyl-CoA dehydrogenase family protein 9
MYGSPEQKAKYLPSLSNGTLKGAFCFSEPHTGVDAAKLRLEGKIDKISNKVYLNGTKSWVTLPTNLDDSENVLFTVITKVINEHVTQNNEENFDISAFLVERSAILDGALKLIKQLDLVNGISLYEIEFNNVSVPLSSQLGSAPDIGYQLTTNLYENSRHLIGAICVGILKDLYRTTIEHSINNIQFERSICEFQMIKERLCKVESRIYAMESMTYLTAGIVDGFEIPDVALESAITKIYCTEALKKSVDDCIQILAMSAYKKLTDVQLKYLNAIDYLLLFSNTNDVLRHYVSFHGAAASAAANAEKIRRAKDLFNNVGFGIRTYIENIKKKRLLQKRDSDFYSLWESVHPSLKNVAYSLEVCSAKLTSAMDIAFIENGSEIVDYQLNMKRLAEMAIEIYLMNSCIARSSRSYAIGMHNCDFEFYLTTVNVHFAQKRFDFQYNQLLNSGNGENVDNLIINIADRALKEKKQSSSHCLSRTFS